MHAFQSSVEANPILIARAIPGKQHYYARVAVIVKSVFQHSQLQHPVRHFLFIPARTSTVKQLDFNAIALRSIPQMPHFRRYRTGSERLFHGPVPVTQAQHIVEVDSNPVAGARAVFQFLGQSLRLVKNVGVVPVNEHLFHSEGPCSNGIRS